KKDGARTAIGDRQGIDREDARSATAPDVVGHLPAILLDGVGDGQADPERELTRDLLAGEKYPGAIAEHDVVWMTLAKDTDDDPALRHGHPPLPKCGGWLANREDRARYHEQRRPDAPTCRPAGGGA